MKVVWTEDDVADVRFNTIEVLKIAAKAVDEQKTEQQIISEIFERGFIEYFAEDDKPD